MRPESGCPIPRPAARRRAGGRRGEDREERFVEDAHRRAHLVERSRLRLAQGRRAPEGVHFGEQAAADLDQHDPAHARVVALLEQIADAADGRGDRSAARLGGVRGEDRAELEAREAVEGLVLAELAGEAAHRGEDRVLRRLCARIGLAPPQHAHPVELLGHVHQVEVAGEGSGHLLGALERQGRDELLRLGHLVGLAAVVGADRQRPQPLDVVVEREVAGFAEDLAEELAQQVDVGPDPLVERWGGGPVGRGGGGGGGCCGRGGRVGERRHGRDLSGGVYRAHDAAVTIRTGMIVG